MGRQKQSRKGSGHGALGKSIMKDRKRTLKGARGGDSWLHTSELQDGYDWARLNLTSVTEQSSLDEFLATAELAGTEFTAEKLNVKVVLPGHNTGILTPEQAKLVKTAQDENKQFLCIPRRPAWDENTTAEALDQMERESFLQWRRQLARLEEHEHLTLTPFERNLDFWRQLWRVIERSDAVVQIVDARNPLLFRSVDLEECVKEGGAHKQNFLLLNKADLLTPAQRSAWAKHFKENGIKAAFWSALAVNGELVDEELEEEEEQDIGSDAEESDITAIKEPEEELLWVHTGSAFQHLAIEDVGGSSDDEEVATDRAQATSDDAQASHMIQSSGEMTAAAESDGDNSESVPSSGSVEWRPVPAVSEGQTSVSAEGSSCSLDDQRGSVDYASKAAEMRENFCASSNSVLQPLSSDYSGKLLTRQELIAIFKDLCRSSDGKELASSRRSVIGLVGYPNVGKSSTINALLQQKKVAVSATPGRTKHFQTLVVDEELTLCDCPGLVFPSFASTKAEMVCNGVLPIDQMRDHEGPINYVCHTIPRSILQQMYGILLPRPEDGEDPNRSPLPIELLMTYGYVRGFMTSKGVPDCPRASRYILKDYVKGKLLYCHPPPGVDASSFQASPAVEGAQSERHSDARIPLALKATRKSDASAVDDAFFRQQEPKACFRSKASLPKTDGLSGLSHQSISGDSMSDTASVTSLMVSGKPWKKHYNRNRTEKTRRVVQGYYE